MSGQAAESVEAEGEGAREGKVWEDDVRVACPAMRVHSVLAVPVEG